MGTKDKNTSNFSKPILGTTITIFVIFGLPAFFVTFMSKNQKWEGEKTALFMVLAFFLSWAIMIFRFKKLVKNFEKENQKNNLDKSDNK